MIPLDHYVPDELHIMLRIWDHLWELVIQELKSESRYEEFNRKIIVREMKSISVIFQFWQDLNVKNCIYTSLMGDDKEKFLYALLLMKQPGADPAAFAVQTKNWLNLFLIPYQ
ncbi:14674_t:CDS:2, partial [Gigaspora margarita]